MSKYTRLWQNYDTWKLPFFSMCLRLFNSLIDNIQNLSFAIYLAGNFMAPFMVVFFLPRYCDTFLCFLSELRYLTAGSLLNSSAALCVWGWCDDWGLNFLCSLPTKWGRYPIQYGLYTRPQSCACRSCCWYYSCHTH